MHCADCKIPELLAALEAIETALRTDSRDKTISDDTVTYHLDGQVMYLAINKARAAIANVRTNRSPATTALKNIHEALVRCDQCDNGIEQAWDYCAWCGHQLVLSEETDR